jgi:hypothetical protein
MNEHAARIQEKSLAVVFVVLAVLARAKLLRAFVNVSEKVVASLE